MELEYHPLADALPLMDGDEFEEFVADIRENGLREPIVVALHEGQAKIVDGRNRHRACKLLGIEPRLVKLPEAQNIAAYIVSQNIMRRHLTSYQRATLVAKFLGGRPNVRLRELAEAAQVHTSTVSRARALAQEDPEAAEQILEGETRYETERKRLDAAEKAAQKTATPRRPPGVYDGTGERIARKDAITDFTLGVQRLNDLATAIIAIRTKIQQGVREGWSEFAFLDTQRTLSDLANAKSALNFARPYALCPYCRQKAEPCTHCRRRGWLPADVYGRLPHEDQRPKKGGG